MAWFVIREIGTLRVLDVYPDSDYTQAEIDALAVAGKTTRRTITDQQFAQYADTPNAALGLALSNAGVFTAYQPTSAVTRAQRRTLCHERIVEGMDLPSLATGKERAAVEVYHDFLRQCYAAATVDANMDNQGRFDAVEDALKGGSFPGGLDAWFDNLVISDSLRTGWVTALGTGEGDTLATNLQTIAAGGTATATAATLPASWNAGETYEPIRARIALRG